MNAPLFRHYRTMRSITLYTLHLHKALEYQTFLGAGNVARSPHDFASIPGEEIIWLFDDAKLIIDDPDSGPRIQKPWPEALFAGLKTEPAQAFDQASLMTVKAGDYLFSQWRKNDFSDPSEGFEEFIRQIWWEQEKTEGPWILRIVREDNDIAFQGLRKKSVP